ncbi:hypothetical protein PROSTU_00835 [Providencia stuartii ATCC 25827]|uniref:Integrase catalytic domain-containing protein n=1 Tax=Providencia stuartii ATCC 25827 TaxID=471874 RepID=A0AA86Z311_PROST|nr:hypothetical protein PROSTU_00835 [Providencia stuartii ATCC 25827]
MMTLIKLPEKAGFALRHAPPEQQRAFLAVIESWPSNVGQSTTEGDNAVVERFFGSLKHDWVLKIPQPTRKQMKEDVTAYMRYYNQDRLHTANGDRSPIEYEQNSLRKVS